MSGFFCPQCQATWDRPWYDVCPACGHRFAGRSAWQSSWLVVLAILATPTALLLLKAMLSADPGASGPGISGDRLAYVNLIGSGLMGVLAATLLSFRLNANSAGRILTLVALAPVFFVVSLVLGFFACVAIPKG